MYADHAATAVPTLYTGFSSTIRGYANPGAAHTAAKQARGALNAARDTIIRALHADPHTSRVVTTSGGTEGTNLVLQGHVWDFIVTVQTEHNATTNTATFLQNFRGVSVVWLPVNGVGRVDPAHVLEAVGRLSDNGRRKGLVSLALVNSEIGTVQDIQAMCRLLRPFRPNLTPDGAFDPAQSVWVHTDAVQAIGHMDVNAVDLEVDFLTLSAHKFHGPPGVGLIWCRGTTPPSNQQRLMHGGHQQDGWRPGTEPVALIVGMADAMRDATAPKTLADRLTLFRAIRATVWRVLLPFIVTGVVLPTGPNNPPERVANHISFCVRNVHRNWLVARLDEGGVHASGGSACNTTSGLPSHVLVAIGVPQAYLQGSVRLTFSHTNTLREVERILCPVLQRTLEAAARQSQNDLDPAQLSQA
jgi:cysteine desulfurase